MPYLRVWATGISLGLLFGFVEAFVRLASLFVGLPKSTGVEVLWIDPAFFGVFAAGVGAVVIAAALVFEKVSKRAESALPRVVPAVVLGVIAFVGFRALFQLQVRTAWYAELLIVVGLAYQTTRLLLNRPESACRALARAAPWGVAVVLLLFVGIPTTKRLDEARRLAALPPPRPNAPNVLLIVLDTVRADHLGTYGYHRPTPALDAFASEGLQFDRAMANASWTLPSHATMITGLYSHEHNAEMNTGQRLDERFYTLAEAFSENGYATAAFVANREYCAATRGFGQGFNHYDDNFWGLHDIVQHSALRKDLKLSSIARRLTGVPRGGLKPAPEINRELVDWLPRRGDRPFFAWLNYMDAHDEYYAPPPYQQLYGDSPANGVSPWADVQKIKTPQVGDEVAQSTRRKIDAYDCALAYLDASLGRLFDDLRRLGLYDDTVILIVADHGEGFGEHLDFGHGKTLFSEVLHVPMLLRYPRAVQPGGHVTTLVGLRDVPATLASLADLRLSQPFPGRVLTGPLEDVPVLAELLQNPYHASKLAVSRGDVVSVRTPSTYAIYTVDGSSLFGPDDAAEQTNLAATEAGQVEVGRLAQDARARWPSRSLPDAWLVPRPDSAAPTAADGQEAEAN